VPFSKRLFSSGLHKKAPASGQVRLGTAGVPVTFEKRFKEGGGGNDRKREEGKNFF